MSAQTPTAYIIVPISEPPTEDGFYFTLMGERNANNWFRDGKWLDEIMGGKPTEVTHWLRPVDLSRMLEEAWEAGAQSESNCIKPEGDCGYDATQHEVDKINYLKSVLNPPK